MDKIEKACRALCHLDTENPDALIYDPQDLEIGISRQRMGIAVRYHRVRLGKEPKPLWTIYVPWAKTVHAALNLDVDLAEIQRELAKEYGEEG